MSPFSAILVPLDSSPIALRSLGCTTWLASRLGAQLHILNVSEPLPEGEALERLGVPEKFRSLGSLEFSKLLIEKADLAVAPGIGFGEHGDEYVRIALVENEQRIRQAARNLRRFLESADKTLHNVVPMAGARR